MNRTYQRGCAVGTNNLYTTPHIYYNGNDPNAATQWVQAVAQESAASGLYAVVDEFGNALDGMTMDPLGEALSSRL
jgi:hypothetical protein